MFTILLSLGCLDLSETTCGSLALQARSNPTMSAQVSFSTSSLHAVLPVLPALPWLPKFCFSVSISSNESIRCVQPLVPKQGWGMETSESPQKCNSAYSTHPLPSPPECLALQSHYLTPSAWHGHGCLAHWRWLLENGKTSLEVCSKLCLLQFRKL